MVNWSTFGRADDVILAVWPCYRPLFETWSMLELVDKGPLPPAWRGRPIPRPDDSVFAEHYPDRDAAFAAAERLNPGFRDALSAR